MCGPSRGGEVGASTARSCKEGSLERGGRSAVCADRALCDAPPSPARQERARPLCCARRPERTAAGHGEAAHGLAAPDGGPQTVRGVRAWHLVIVAAGGGRGRVPLEPARPLAARHVVPHSRSVDNAAQQLRRALRLPGALAAARLPHVLRTRCGGFAFHSSADGTFARPRRRARESRAQAHARQQPTQSCAGRVVAAASSAALGGPATRPAKPCEHVSRPAGPHAAARVINRRAPPRGRRGALRPRPKTLRQQAGNTCRICRAPSVHSGAPAISADAARSTRARKRRGAGRPRPAAKVRAAASRRPRDCRPGRGRQKCRSYSGPELPSICIDSMFRGRPVPSGERTGERERARSAAGDGRAGAQAPRRVRRRGLRRRT
jgi:hypothetical protein